MGRPCYMHNLLARTRVGPPLKIVSVAHFLLFAPIHVLAYLGVVTYGRKRNVDQA
jgi:hypothetical protein